MRSSVPVVVDASVALAIILDEPIAATIVQALGRWTRAGRQLITPSGFWLEVVNVLARAKRASGVDLIHGIHVLDGLGIVTVELDRPDILMVIDLVERYRLSAYDAAYLQVAAVVGADLATLDRALAIAAGPRAVSFDGGRRLSEATVPFEATVTWPDYREASAFLAKLRADALAERDAATHGRATITASNPRGGRPSPG